MRSLNAAQPGMAAPAAPVALRCPCGRAAPLATSPVTCECGRRLGEAGDGLWRIGPAAPYWGEVGQARLEEVLAIGRRRGWRTAAEQRLPELLGYLTDPRRAAFGELLPVPPGGRVLELGAGLGAVAAALARDYQVVALEGVEARAQFLALRAAQEGLAQLRVIRADWHRIQFAPGQFDGIVLNGALEWAALGDRAGSPRQAQLRFLRRIRQWLAPRGCLYVAIENRFGWPEWRGAVDHSGLPYTSLLPRWLARGVCRWLSPYRSGDNLGYRTYTYSYGGYRRLFAAAGLRLAASYVCPHGYNLPTDLVPLAPAGFRWQTDVLLRGRGARGPAWHRRLAGPWLYRALGGDFALFLEAAAAPPAVRSVADKAPHA